MWRAIYPSCAFLSRGSMLGGIAEDLASQFHDVPTSIVAGAIAQGLGKALDFQGVPASDVDCVRDYSALCPEGWADQGDGETCAAPMYYQGQCARREDFSSLTPTEKRAKASRCGSQFACVDACPMDFASPCPDDWDIDRSNHCIAPPQYAGPCIGRKDFRGISSSEKSQWSSLCSARWPCRRQLGDAIESEHERGCPADFSKTCPSDWVTVGFRCVAPVGYGGPCAAMVDLRSLTVSQKDAYATTCSTPWPCGKGRSSETHSSFLQYAQQDDNGLHPHAYLVNSNLQASQLNVAKLEVLQLIPRVDAGGWMATKALTRLVSMTADPNAKTVMIGAGVEAAAETLLKRPGTSDRNIALAGSLLTMLSGMPVAVEVSDEAGANGHVDVIIPRPSRVYQSDELLVRHSFGVN